MELLDYTCVPVNVFIFTKPRKIYLFPVTVPKK